jgi:hypothetical protein
MSTTAATPNRAARRAAERAARSAQARIARRPASPRIGLLDPNAHARALAKAQEFSSAEAEQLTAEAHKAFQAFRHGGGTRAYFDTLAIVVNVVLVRGESIDAASGGGDVVVSAAKAAQDALMRALARHQRLKRWGFDAAGLAAMETALDVHDQLLQLGTIGQMIDALGEVQRRMQRGQVLENG